MKHLFKTALGVCIILTTAYGQIKMRPLEELIVKDNSTWSMLQQWIKEAKNPVVVLPKNNARADSALYLTQVTTHSPMGAVIYETGGILIDSGWIRVLGSGSNRLDRSLMDWNKGKSFNQFGEQPSFLLIADDVLGGFFAINAGGIDTSGIGKVFYFAPDNIKWENTKMSYTDFLLFCFKGNLDGYYGGLRWVNWKKETAALDGNSAISFFPFLWSKEGRKNLNKDIRERVPIQELWDLHFTKSN